MIRTRLRTSLLVALATLVAASCERISVGPEIASELARGRHFVQTLAAARDRPAASIDSQTAIALGYLERHRLGLGSPFRLIDYALHDPRLADSTRTSLAWALLARTADGDGYQLDPALLDSIGAVPSPGGGRAHLELIESVVRDAHDPRAGELAVRLGYGIAAAERDVRSRAPLLSARVAALLRDRELAREDVRELLRAARRQDASPLALVQLWRADRRFMVEQPPMMPLSEAAQREGMDETPKVLDRLRELAAHPDSTPERSDDAGTMLGAGAAARLAQIAHAESGPPETPVVLAMAGYRHAIFTAPGYRASRPQLGRFVWRSRSEESLAAEHALLLGVDHPSAVELAMLSAAVWLRSYAQELPWLPGDPGPSARELRSRFGLAAVTFDDDVPEEWRPYYRTMLASSLQDLARVVPSLDLTGLRVHFGESALRNAALALHDPVKRTIYLPLATSAGTIAHEVAHDIDWQAARSRWNTWGDYATDRAVRESRGRLAASLRGLTAASLTPPPSDGAEWAPVSQRPTEVFARGVDWFVAVSLAHEGRMNGYLSSVQDDLLTGYVTVTPPDVTGEAGWELVNVLDDVASIDVRTRDWFLTRYGPGRAVTPYDLVRRVLEVPVDSAGESDSVSLMELVAPVLRARNTALALLDAERCRPGADGREVPDAAARRRLVLLAAGARAAGIMRDRGTVLAAEEARRWSLMAPYAATQPWLIAPSAHPDLAAAADEMRRTQSLLSIDSGLAGSCGAPVAQ